MQRRKLKDSMRNGKKKRKVRGDGGVDRKFRLFTRPLTTPFHSLPRSPRYPGDGWFCPFCAWHRCAADTFNSLLIPWLLLLPPLARRAGGGSHHSSSLYFEYSTRIWLREEWIMAGATEHPRIIESSVAAVVATGARLCSLTRNTP